MLNVSRNNSWSTLVQVAAFLFGALSLAIPSGYSYGPGLLLLVGLYFLYHQRNQLSLPIEFKWVAISLITFFAVMLLSVLVDGGRLSELDRPSRALMVAAMLPLLAVYRVNISVLLSGYAVGAIIALGVASYDKFVLGYERAFGNMMPIQSGNIAMLMGLFCLCGIFWAQQQKKWAFSCIMGLGAFSGMAASFLSGSRGGWVLLPVILVTILMMFKERLGKKGLFSFIAIMLLCGGLVAQPQSGVEARLELAQNDITQYLDKTNLNTSLGIRFQLWASAWQSFTEKPLFGWGNHGLQQFKSEQLKEGDISPFIYHFKSHAHNQFLDEMAKRGIIGLFALLAIFMVPIYLVRKNMPDKDNADGYCGMALVIVTVFTTIDYCLSQAYLSHNSGMTFFFSSLALALSVVLNRGETKNYDGNAFVVGK